MLITYTENETPIYLSTTALEIKYFNGVKAASSIGSFIRNAYRIFKYDMHFMIDETLDLNISEKKVRRVGIIDFDILDDEEAWDSINDVATKYGFEPDVEVDPYYVNEWLKILFLSITLNTIKIYFNNNPTCPTEFDVKNKAEECFWDKVLGKTDRKLKGIGVRTIDIVGNGLILPLYIMDIMKWDNDDSLSEACLISSGHDIYDKMYQYVSEICYLD